MHKTVIRFGLILNLCAGLHASAAVEKVFEYSFGRELQSVPAVDDDGTIYLAGKGAVAALTATGSEKWKVELSPDSKATVGGVTISDDRIYVASGEGLYAFDKGGDPLWMKEGSFGRSRVALDGPDSLYAVEGGQQTALRAFRSDGSERWSSSSVTGSYPIVEYTDFGPSVGPNGMIFTTAGILAAYSREGEMLWTGAGFTFSSPPVVNADGSIFFTPRHDPLYFITHRIDTNGVSVWNTGPISGSGGGTAWSPAVGPDKTLYIPTAQTSVQNRGLIAFGEDGQRKWNFSEFSVLSSPAIASNRTIYIAGEGIVAAINPEGSRIWSFTNGVPVVKGLAIGLDGDVLVAQTNGTLIALSGSSRLAAGVWASYGGDSKQTAEQRQLGALRVKRIEGGGALFLLTGVPGEAWDIETSEDLRTWSNGGTFTIGASGTVAVQRPASSSTLFLRARRVEAGALTL